MEKHLTILSALFVAMGAFGMVAAGLTFLALTGSGLLSGDRDAILITSGIGVAVAALLAALSLPSLIAGIALYLRTPWARLLALVLACLHLLSIPLGLLFGIYALWVLLDENTARLLASEPGDAAVVLR